MTINGNYSQVKTLFATNGNCLQLISLFLSTENQLEGLKNNDQKENNDYLLLDNLNNVCRIDSQISRPSSRLQRHSESDSHMSTPL